MKKGRGLDGHIWEEAAKGSVGNGTQWISQRERPQFIQTLSHCVLGRGLQNGAKLWKPKAEAGSAPKPQDLTEASSGDTEAADPAQWGQVPGRLPDKSCKTPAEPTVYRTQFLACSD